MLIMKKDMTIFLFSDNNPKPSMTQNNSLRKFTTEFTLFAVMDIEKGTTYPMLVNIFWKGGQEKTTLIYLKEAETVYKALPFSKHG